MFHPHHPMVLDVGPAERDKALVWLMKNHPKLDCVVVDKSDGGVEIRVAAHDAGVLDALADMLDGA